MLIRFRRLLCVLSCVLGVCLLGLWKREQWASTRVYLGPALLREGALGWVGNAEGAARSWEDKALPDVHEAKIQQPLEDDSGVDPATAKGSVEFPWILKSAIENEDDDAMPPYEQPSWPADMKAYLKELLTWDRPVWQGHWPPWADYVDKEYDPNRWEAFELDNRIYEAGLDTLSEPEKASLTAYTPFPEYNSKAWRKEWRGKYVACKGPRGLPLDNSSEDEVHAYQGVPPGFPEVFAGGYGVVGLDADVCFDRDSRYGAYGFGDEKHPEDVGYVHSQDIGPEWSKVHWGALQDDCFRQNENRYRPEARNFAFKALSPVLPSVPSAPSPSNRDEQNVEKSGYHHRTAVLIRAWTGYAYEENDIITIRAMVSELSLRSGGEYHVFLYVHVRDKSLPIFTNQTLYDEILRDNVPEELRDMAILWSESIVEQWYPNVGDWQVYWQQFMCLQYFSVNHPEFDFVWNWETDARYTGHHYHFFEQVARFADNQPRKLLWERNKRYFLPSVHGSYRNFVESTHRDVLNASVHSLIPPPIWGPRPWVHAEPPQQPLGPTPPHSFDADNFTWGVGEAADLITLLPIWDPRNTSWSYKDKIWNYVPGERPHFSGDDHEANGFTHSDFAHLDRRTFINTVARFSSKLLRAMHVENLAGRSMQAEMWPASAALQHGLKAVYVPHPIFNDREWPAPYAASIFDTAATIDDRTGGAMDTVQGAWTEQADSPYKHDRESNFGGWSWYFSSRFPRNLYRRWLGWDVVVEELGKEDRVVGESNGTKMCLPGMLLHPVKRMNKQQVNL